MKQILHILRKDARHHWPEILAALILLTACFAEEPREWAHRAPTTPFFSFLAGALPVLLFVSWAFLIERLVHGESLVGERQFWITRPYEWRKLLAAQFLGIVNSERLANSDSAHSRCRSMMIFTRSLRESSSSPNMP